MEKEEWRWIEGFEGMYEVSSLGNVRSYVRSREPRPIKSYTDERGYVQVVFTVKRKARTHWLHRLVAKAFLPNPENKPTVNHKDTIKTNNCADNLEWATSKENSLNGYRMGVVVPPKVRGEEGNHKLTEDQVKSIRVEYVPRKNSYAKLGKKYGVSGQSIKNIMLGKTWAHI